MQNDMIHVKGNLPIPRKITSARFLLANTLAFKNFYAKDTLANVQNYVYTRQLIAALLKRKQSKCPFTENWLSR